MRLRPAPHPVEGLSDEDLMTRIQGDDLCAFEELYDRYSAKAFGLARFVCRGSQRSEDAVQEGFLAVWRSRTSYDPARGSPQAWLLTTVRHRSIDMMRAGGRHDRNWAPEEQLNYIPASGSVAEDVERRDEGGRLRAALLELPERQREVITLACFGGLSHTEIAARLELPAGTVKGRMRLGLNKMRADTHPKARSPEHEQLARDGSQDPTKPPSTTTDAINPAST